MNDDLDAAEGQQHTVVSENMGHRTKRDISSYCVPYSQKYSA